MWGNEFRFVTRKELLEHTRTTDLPKINYYNNIFNDEKGDCCHIRQMMRAAKSFDPLFLTEKLDAEIVTMLHPLADKLLYFGYNHSADFLLFNLKKRASKDFRGD